MSNMTPVDGLDILTEFSHGRVRQGDILVLNDVQTDHPCCPAYDRQVRVQVDPPTSGWVAALELVCPHCQTPRRLSGSAQVRQIIHR